MNVTLQEGFWAHDINFGSVDGVLEYYWCPPGYCRCSSNNECNSVYYYDDNDLQCVCDRQGEGNHVVFMCNNVCYN